MKFSPEDVKCLVRNRMERKDGICYLTAEAALKFLGPALFEVLKNHEVYKRGPFPNTYYPDGVEYIMDKYPPEYEFRSDDGYKFVKVADHPDVPSLVVNTGV